MDWMKGVIAREQCAEEDFFSFFLQYSFFFSFGRKQKRETRKRRKNVEKKVLKKKFYSFIDFLLCE